MGSYVSVLFHGKNANRDKETIAYLVDYNGLTLNYVANDFV